MKLRCAVPIAMSLILGFVISSCGRQPDGTTATPVPSVDLTIRAASLDPVPDWEKMESAGGSSELLWVAPEAALTLADVESAKETKDELGRPAIDLRFSTTGSQRMRNFSASQIGKKVAIVLEGKVLSAPVVNAQISDRALIAPVGRDDIDRILGSVNRR